MFSVAGPKVQLFVLLALERSRQMARPQGRLHYRLDYQPMVKRLGESKRPEEAVKSQRSLEGQ